MSNSNYNNNNNNERGIKVGNKYRCFKLVTGNGSKGLWGFFSWVDKSSSYNQKYNIFIDNQDVLANFPLDRTVDVFITKITSIKPTTSTYQDKNTGKNVTTRIITVNCECSLVEINNFQQPQPQPQQNYQQPTYREQENYQQQEQTYGSSVEDIELPF